MTLICFCRRNRQKSCPADVNKSSWMTVKSEIWGDGRTTAVISPLGSSFRRFGAGSEHLAVEKSMDPLRTLTPPTLSPHPMRGRGKGEESRVATLSAYRRFYLGPAIRQPAPGFSGLRNSPEIKLIPSINQTATVPSSCWKSKSVLPSPFKSSVVATRQPASPGVAGVQKSASDEVGSVHIPGRQRSIRMLKN